MNRLIVPVYLNQKLVFDLLAMLQGGISTVTSVTESLSNSKSEDKKISSTFGLNEALSTLLKINLSGSQNRISDTEETNISSQERIHTPASLLFQLRNLLIDKEYLSEKQIEFPKAGDFVEFEGFLKRNPIVETIDSLAEMMDIAQTFDNKSQSNNTKRSTNQSSEYQKIRQQMIKFSQALKAGSTIDLSSVNLEKSYTAVVTVETSFLNDPLMSDLVDGQFKVIGKVIKSVRDSKGSINLLRKTALSKMPSEILLQAIAQLSSLGNEKGFDLPELTLEIKGPAIQILPIAIYA